MLMIVPMTRMMMAVYALSPARWSSCLQRCCARCSLSPCGRSHTVPPRFACAGTHTVPPRFACGGCDRPRAAVAGIYLPPSPPSLPPLLLSLPSLVFSPPPPPPSRASPPSLLPSPLPLPLPSTTMHARYPPCACGELVAGRKMVILMTMRCYCDLFCRRR